jgi:hypothetical protein
MKLLYRSPIFRSMPLASDPLAAASSMMSLTASSEPSRSAVNVPSSATVVRDGGVLEPGAVHMLVEVVLWPHAAVDV